MNFERRGCWHQSCLLNGVTDADLVASLRELFGFEQFRPGQERAVRSLLAGRDVLAILPTGAGKSLIYQLASQLLPGVTLVVSPLIALMKDQAAGLAAVGIPVGVVSSAENSSDIDDALQQAVDGRCKLLYVTPERLENPSFLSLAQKMNVSLVVVDEAHSISEWGQSFRPAYLNLPASLRQLGTRPVLLALTATATPWVRSDMINGLELRSPDVIVHGTFRQNLFLEVLRVEEEAEDRRVMRSLLTGEDALTGSGIVYVGTTRAARDTAEWLTDWGITADFYHGQRPKADRDRVQDGFMSGAIRVIAATNAFGLGIDKPDIRFVIHRDVPSGLERYYQEAGRAGRDGGFSRCVLIYRPGDLGRAAFLAGGGELTREEVVRAHAGLAALRGRSATLAELQHAAGLGRADFLRLIAILEDENVLRRRGRRFEMTRDFDPEALPLEREAARRAYDHSRLEMMRGYAELRDCRWRYILNYFGEEPDWEICSACDVDARVAAQSEQQQAPSAGEASTADLQSVNGPFAVNDRVVHVSMGEGVVQRVTADSITVLFEQNGFRTLDTSLILEEDLVQRVGQ